MKYQQLENLESGWKWKYLVKKHREGELITCYIEASAAQEAVDMLLTLENEPVQVNGWIEKHINPALLNRMKQTIRARRDGRQAEKQNQPETAFQCRASAHP